MAAADQRRCSPEYRCSPGFSGAAGPGWPRRRPRRAPGTVDVTLDTLTPPRARQGRHRHGLRHAVQRQQDRDHRRPCRAARRGSALGGRSAIDDGRQAHRLHPGRDRPGGRRPYTVKVTRLAAGVSRYFTLTVPVRNSDLGEDGVYQLGVSLSGRTSDRALRARARHRADVPALAAGGADRRRSSPTCGR